MYKDVQLQDLDIQKFRSCISSCISLVYLDMLYNDLILLNSKCSVCSDFLFDCHSLFLRMELRSKGYLTT